MIILQLRWLLLLGGGLFPKQAIVGTTAREWLSLDPVDVLRHSSDDRAKGTRW